MRWTKILAAVFLLAVGNFGVAADEVPTEKMIEIVDPVKNYDQQDQYRSVSVVGYLKNLSSSYIEGIVVEAQFYDSNGKLIDSVTQELYSMVLPPNDSTAFVVRTQAQSAASEYATFKTRVTYAEKKSQCTTSKKKQNWLVSALINWAPLIILLGAWIVIMMRFQKKSPQTKVLELVEQQNELIRINGEQFKEFLEVVREYTKKST